MDIKKATKDQLKDLIKAAEKELKARADAIRTKSLQNVQNKLNCGTDLRVADLLTRAAERGLVIDVVCAGCGQPEGHLNGCPNCQVGIPDDDQEGDATIGDLS